MGTWDTRHEALGEVGSKARKPALAGSHSIMIPTYIRSYFGVFRILLCSIRIFCISNSSAARQMYIASDTTARETNGLARWGMSHTQVIALYV